MKQATVTTNKQVTLHSLRVTNVRVPFSKILYIVMAATIAVLVLYEVNLKTVDDTAIRTTVGRMIVTQHQREPQNTVNHNSTRIGRVLLPESLLK